MRRIALFLAGAAVALCCLLLVGTENSEAPVDETQAPTSAAATQLTTSAAAPIAPRQPSPGPWNLFRERFGPGLRADFTPEGRLSSVVGRFGAGKRAGSGFNPEDPRQAIARAREILASAREMLGLSEAWPLGTPTARTSRVSAQVYFQQTRGGVPVAPSGTISVDLDSQGGLVRLDSSYTPDAEIRNEPKLEAREGKLRALGAVGTQEAALRAEGGSTVLWVSRNRTGNNEARYAYEYTVQGREVIVDAANGAILHKRDIRQY